ncbi:hypothetical protein QTG54_008271 [Skeletonema marinoi]|uniref:Subtilisin n=1 Tax=Skeletonema marinoi TaxID=267567 RepID=A0AAD8Y8M0_9STRA|nr:hypothetical protein QTG54_008271 [Skeletonema marinoi]
MAVRLNFITAAAAAIILHVAAARDDIGASNVLKVHQPRHAPPRPADAPDVDYENHPFDQYRHLYDDRHYHERRRRRDSKSSHQNDGLRSRIRWLKNNNDEDSMIYAQTQDVLSDNNFEETKTTESTTTNTSPTTTLDPTTDSLYKPLRIQFDVRHLIKEMEIARSSGNTIVMTKLQLLIYEVLPMTAQVWGDTLRVIPGSSAEAWLPNDGEGSNEQDAGSNPGNDGTESVLYEDPVRVFYCPDETTSGISGGADLLIYATVNRHCGGEIYIPTSRNRRTRSGNNQAQEAGGGGGTLASALSCQRDQYDRPITGSIDFCLSGMDGTSSVDVDEAIAQKESQGFGPSPNDNGENVIVGSNGASTIWDGWFGKSMDLDSPLETNGMLFSILLEWLFMAFFTDIMGAVFSPAVNVLSPLVLAYLEDSGWYRANYQSNYVHIGTFGHGAGCAFLEESCIDSDGNVPEAMEGTFATAYCDWVDTNALIGIGKTGQTLESAPEFFQYVDDNSNLRPYTFTAADYCPIPHLSQYSCFVDGGRATQEQLNAGEYYGSDSRCVETDGRGECVYRSDDDTADQPLAKCVCDSEDDTTKGCFRTPLKFSESYGPAIAQTNRANKAVFLAIVGSLVIGLAILYIVVRQWKARQNVFM